LCIESPGSSEHLFSATTGIIPLILIAYQWLTVYIERTLFDILVFDA
jgi:hypothetical protein